MLPLITPPQSQPLLDGNRCDRTYYLFFESLAQYAAGGGGVVQFGTRRARQALSTQGLPNGGLWLETDTDLLYQWQVTPASMAWVYFSGTFALEQADLAAFQAGLRATDAGLLVNVTDYAHILAWDGSAWTWGPGEAGSGMLQPFAVAPTGTGWHECNGASAVPYLLSDGTLGAVNLPNSVATAAYLKASASYNPTISAATNPSFSGGSGVTGTGFASLGNDTDVGVLVNVGTATLAALKPHQHIDGGHTHAISASGTVGLPGDPVANFSVLLYFRQ